MSALTTQPTNQSFLSPLGFQLVIKKTPNTVYFVQKVNIPNVSLGTAAIPTPFSVIPTPGTKLTYGQLRVEFKVDENLSNYIEIFTWMRNIGFPDNFDQHAAIANATPQSGDGIYSDVVLNIADSNMRINRRVHFHDCYPVDLSEITMDSTSVDVDYITATVTFAYRKFDIGAV